MNGKGFARGQARRGVPFSPPTGKGFAVGQRSPGPVRVGEVFWPTATATVEPLLDPEIRDLKSRFPALLRER